MQPQAVVDLPPHPPGVVSPFEYYVGNAPRTQLLGDRKPAGPSAHNHDIETLNRHSVLTRPTPLLRDLSNELDAQFSDHFRLAVVLVRQTQQLVLELHVPHRSRQLGFEAPGRPTLRHYLDKGRMKATGLPLLLVLNVQARQLVVYGLAESASPARRLPGYGL